MGGKKFDTAQPEGYLFGDNSDLNYLGPKPHNVSILCFANLNKRQFLNFKVFIYIFIFMINAFIF